MLEFFPWTPVRDLAAAVSVVEAAGRPEAGILVDTLHFDRSGSRLEQLDTVPASRLPMVHVRGRPGAGGLTRPRSCCTPTRSERLPPGEGGIDIRGIVRRMPPGIPVALEVPMPGTVAEGAEAAALRVRQAAERVLAG